MASPERESIELENVWQYPRPPVVVACTRRARVMLEGELLADSHRALRVLETSHPPTIYVPLTDVREDLLAKSDAPSTECEFKGAARYIDAEIFGHHYEVIGWMYPNPSPGYEELRNHLAFYPGRVDAAWLDDELVQAQSSHFYGGWITSGIVGPFKGALGSAGW